MQAPLLNAALQEMFTTGLCHCHYTYEDLLITQLISDPTPIHCSTALGKMQALLLSAAMQKRLTAGLCHCQYTYEDFYFIQLSSDPTPIHYSTA